MATVNRVYITCDKCGAQWVTTEEVTVPTLIFPNADPKTPDLIVDLCEKCFTKTKVGDAFNLAHPVKKPRAKKTP